MVDTTKAAASSLESPNDPSSKGRSGTSPPDDDDDAEKKSAESAHRKSRSAANRAVGKKDEEAIAQAELVLAQAAAARDLAITKAKSTKTEAMNALKTTLNAATEAVAEAETALKTPKSDALVAKQAREDKRSAISHLGLAAKGAATVTLGSKAALVERAAELKSAQDNNKAAGDAMAALASIDSPDMKEIKEAVKSNTLDMSKALVTAKAAMDDAKNDLARKTAQQADAEAAVKDAEAASKAADADYAAKNKAFEKATATLHDAVLVEDAAKKAVESAEAKDSRGEPSSTIAKKQELDIAKAKADYSAAEAAYFKTLADIAAAASCRVAAAN